MQTIQVVLEEELLKETDRAARRGKVNRSALIRVALRAHLQQIKIRELEARDRKGYGSVEPQAADTGLWEKEAAWPED